MSYFNEIIFCFKKVFSVQKLYFAFLLNEPLVTLPLLILGIFFICPHIFSSLCIMTLFAKSINKLLKYLWQVPINPDIDSSAAWAFPSGHAGINMIIWLYLLLFIRKKRFFVIMFVVLLLQNSMMVYYHYHVWNEIFASIAIYSILAVVYYYIIQYKLVKIPLCSFVMAIITFAILMYLPDTPKRYIIVWRNLGMLLSLTWVFFMFEKNKFENKFDYVINNKLLISALVAVIFMGNFVVMSIISPNVLSYIICGMVMGMVVYLLPLLDKLITNSSSIIKQHGVIKLIPFLYKR